MDEVGVALKEERDKVAGRVGFLVKGGSECRSRSFIHHRLGFCQLFLDSTITDRSAPPAGLGSALRSRQARLGSGLPERSDGVLEWCGCHGIAGSSFAYSAKGTSIVPPAPGCDWGRSTQPINTRPITKPRSHLIWTISDSELLSDEQSMRAESADSTLSLQTQHVRRQGKFIMI